MLFNDILKLSLLKEFEFEKFEELFELKFDELLFEYELEKFDELLFEYELEKFDDLLFELEFDEFLFEYELEFDELLFEYEFELEKFDELFEKLFDSLKLLVDSSFTKLFFTSD